MNDTINIGQGAVARPAHHHERSESRYLCTFEFAKRNHDRKRQHWAKNAAALSFPPGFQRTVDLF